MAELTDAEAAVYDRQLRVWGVEVQKRLRNARVLIVGCTGLAAEVAKNIVLAGVGSLHILDDSPSTSGSDTNFLNQSSDPSVSVASASAKALSEMNPMVSIAARTGPASPSKEIAQDYDVVLLIGRPLGSLVVWDTICRDNNVKFFAAVSRGTQAFFFSNLGEHTFQPPEVEGKVQDIRSKSYGRLIDALQHSWKSITNKTHRLMPVLLLCATKEGEVGDFLDSKDSADILAFGYNLAKTQGASPKVIDTGTLQDYLGSPEEMAAVNSIVGGVLANEVLKAVSGKGEPFDNLFLYSMADGGGMIERMAPAVKVVSSMSALASKLDQKQAVISI